MPLVVVVIDELFHGGYQFFISFKIVEIVHLTFQNAPEALHRAIINASTYSGHALRHSLLVQFSLEYLACILKSTVAVE